MFAPPIPAKTSGTMYGGTPPDKDSRNIVCSILRCSRRSDSCRVFSSSCFLLSSSDLARSQFRIDSSAPCHEEGAAGNWPMDRLLVGGFRSGLGKVIAAGGGRPRCGVLILLGGLSGRGGREAEAPGGEK